MIQGDPSDIFRTFWLVKLCNAQIKNTTIYLYMTHILMIGFQVVTTCNRWKTFSETCKSFVRGRFFINSQSVSSQYGRLVTTITSCLSAIKWFRNDRLHTEIPVPIKRERIQIRILTFFYFGTVFVWLFFRRSRCSNKHSRGG